MKKVKIYLQNHKLEIDDDSDTNIQNYSDNISKIFESDQIIKLVNSQQDKSLIIPPSCIVAVSVEEINEHSEKEDEHDIITDINSD